jgi:hypothetical protein
MAGCQWAPPAAAEVNGLDQDHPVGHTAAVLAKLHPAFPPRVMNFLGLAPVHRNMARVKDD